VLILKQFVLIPSECFSKGSDLLNFLKIIPLVRMRILGEPLSPRIDSVDFVR
jgi:hypothetical protein